MTSDKYFEFTPMDEKGEVSGEAERLDIELLLGPDGTLTTSRGAISATDAELGGWRFMPAVGHEAQFVSKWEALKQRRGRLSLKAAANGGPDSYLASVFLPQ
jgi:hypothetical protein